MLARVKVEGGRNRDLGGGGLRGIFDVIRVADELKFTTHPPGEKTHRELLLGNILSISSTR